MQESGNREIDVNTTVNFSEKVENIVYLLNDKALLTFFVYASFGEKFDGAKHTQGTEIKAITYSNMQIHETVDRSDLYVIVDI